MLSAKEIFSVDCEAAIDTWVYEALNVLHHQLTGQTNGMLEVSRGHIPVRMVFMATAEPEGHHRKEKMNNCIDTKAWSWKRRVSIRIVISVTVRNEKEAVHHLSALLIPFDQTSHSLRRCKEKEFTTDREYRSSMAFSFLFLHDFRCIYAQHPFPYWWTFKVFLYFHSSMKIML